MIALEDAQARLLALATPVAPILTPLIAAAGRWLGEDIVARRTQPHRDLSAMDGYAIRFADRGGPWQLAGESAAGHAYAGTIGPGVAVRIFTGAVIPEGADTVIMQEEVIAEGGAIRLTGDAPARIGQHVRAQGSDFADGQCLLPRGTRLGAAHVGLAAMAGYDRLPVARPLRVAIVSTGDELVAPGTPTRPDQIPSSNAPMLAALLAGLGVEIDDRGIVPDQKALLSNVFGELCHHDVIVTIGGASVGDHDLVRPALIDSGADIDFWKIAMRPGKPVMAGRLGDAIVLGLPGNPVSAYVTAVLLLMPLVARLGGASDPLPTRLTARLGGGLAANGNRTDHVRAILANGIATPVGVNDSAMLAALARANALIVRPPGAPAALAGDAIDVIALP